MAAPRLEMEIAFRPRVPADDDYIRALSAGAFAAFARDGGRAVRGMMREPGTRTEIAVLSSETYDDPVGFVVVALSGIVCSEAPAIASRTIPARAAHLCAIATDPQLRRRGIGAQLLARAEHLAKQNGALCLSLTTAVNNVAARGLFLSAGYLLMANAGDFYTEGQDAVFMLKPL